MGGAHAWHAEGGQGRPSGLAIPGALSPHPPRPQEALAGARVVTQAAFRQQQGLGETQGGSQTLGPGPA